ncbi:MAG: STAS domain-containing protein [Fibrobacteres bacterium]|nr:STAS domain-containing protein [Fibrobacterota bacterium]
MGNQITIAFKDIPGKADSRLVEFVGDLDATNVENVLERIIALMNDGIVHIVADFEKLRYVNSTGLGILLHFSKMAKEKGGCFKIAHVNEHVFEIIEIIGATTLLEIYDSVEEAIGSL